MLLKHQLGGRFGMLLGICLLGTACGEGEIGGSRLGPDTSDPDTGFGVDTSDPDTGFGVDTSDPDIGNVVSPLVCSEASADVSASDGWRSSNASRPASGELRFEFKARPTAANLDGIVAVGAQEIDAFSKAAIAVRFAENGFVDARDGGIYGSDVSYPYDPGVWYSITVTADIQSKTYDVEIGPCSESQKSGESQTTLIEDASFRDDANVSGQLSAWGVWSSQSAALEVSTPAWIASSEGCVPSTCETLGHVCGQPSDGCGGALSCGTCGNGEMCSSGVCIDESTPPPPCQPATCQTLSAECGLQSDGCGGTLSCGGCGSGESCSSGTCVANSTSPPPAGSPPAGSPGDPYVHVTPADVGVSIGPGVIAAYPTSTYSGSCTITTPGTTIENRIINCSSLNIYANNVTVRNSVLNLTGSTIGVRIGNGSGSTATGLTIEYSHVNYQNDGKIFVAYNDASNNGDYRNITIRNNDIEGGHDFFYLEGNLDGLVVENNVLGPLGCAPGSDPHADAFQIGAVNPASGAIVIRGNYFDPSADCSKTAIYYMAKGTVSATIESNLLTTWGAFTLWPSDVDTAQIRYNLYDSVFESQVGNRCGCQPGDNTPCCSYPEKAAEFNVTGAPSSSYVCNRYESDGSFIEQQDVGCEGGTSCVPHVTSACPSYTPR